MSANIQTISGTINGVNVTFTVPTSVQGTTMISLNGVLYFENVHYTISGTTITFITAPAADLAGTVFRLILVSLSGSSSDGTNILPYALTTLQRVKDRIFDTNINTTQPDAFDGVLVRMINGVTDWFERETGGRRFVMTRYTNERYSASSSKMKRLVLKQAPVTFLTVTGDTTLGSVTIASISNTTAMVVGMPIEGEGIPSGATVASVGVSSIDISSSAIASGSGSYFQANGIISFEYRAGPPSNPNWTAFINDQFELVNDGKAGVLRIYGALPDFYVNMARVTYYAGYPVDWINAGNYTTHMLPADISDMVENVVVRRFKRRLLAGKQSEGLEGSTTSWRDELDSDDLAVIGHYRRMPTIF